jgi:L-ectoine synthase
MIVRKLADAGVQGRCVSAPGWESNRLLLEADKTGFSFHITRIVEGAELHMHYQNHIEAVYCVRGKGEVVNIAEDETHPIASGTLYVLDQHDKHVLRAFEELELVCVFNPPLMGREVHNAEGAYALEADVIR